MTEETVLGEVERSNAARVTEFCKAWASRDVQLLVPFLSERVEYQMWDSDDAIIVHGVEQFVETLSPFFDSTTRIDFEILRTQAMGKIVINERHDLFCFEGGTEWFFPVVGVFVLEERKIISWKDYVTPGKKTRM